MATSGPAADLEQALPADGGVLSTLAQAKEAVQSAVGDAVQVVVDAVPDDTKAGITSAVATVQGFAKDQQERFEDLREFLEMWVKRKVQRQIEAAVDKLPGVLKESVEDPDMPRFVARGKDRAIESMWPDFKEEIMWEVAVLIDAEDETVEEDKSPGPDCIRAFFRYHILPCDKTIWGNLRDPVWLIFTLLSLTPWVGMMPLLFLFLFLVIDKTDEFQLCSFILQFKGMQFLSAGIVRTIVGYFQYLGCVTAQARMDGHACDTRGPGISGRMELVMGSWLLQVVLIWLAYLLLPCSKEKGRRRLKGKVEFEHQSSRAEKDGGYIRPLMVFDLVVFLLCCAVLGWTVSTRPGHAYDGWVVKQVLYACQIVYGFMSLPFFLFTLPVLQRVLLHSVPTAYDREGRCVQVTGPPRPKAERAFNLEKFLDPEEAQKLVDDARRIVLRWGSRNGLLADTEQQQQQEQQQAAGDKQA